MKPALGERPEAASRFPARPGPRRRAAGDLYRSRSQLLVASNHSTTMAVLRFRRGLRIRFGLFGCAGVRTAVRGARMVGDAAQGASALLDFVLGALTDNGSHTVHRVPRAATR